MRRELLTTIEGARLNIREFKRLRISTGSWHRLYVKMLSKLKAYHAIASHLR